MSHATFLDQVIPLDQVLRDPLDIRASKVTRRTLIRVLLEQLGFEDRLLWHTVTDHTYYVVSIMLEELVAALEDRRISPNDRPFRIATGDAHLPPAETLQAIIDLGWGHIEVPAGPVWDITNRVRNIYARQMTQRVLVMLRRWEREGGWVQLLAA